MTVQTIAFADLLRSKPKPKLPEAPPQAPAPTSSEAEEGEPYRLHRRFDRMGRLLGDDGMSRLFRSRVVVIGIGGVGSWAAESLARSGVGRISLVDFDLVCVTNANRQLHALKGTTGKPKVEVMAERLRLIHPKCEVVAVREFYNEGNSDTILGPAGDPPDLVIDAIDNLAAKTHLIASCRARGIPLIISGGASGRLDPTKIRESDLTQVQSDPFIAATRKILRRSHDFPKGDGDWGLRTIHSTERPAAPRALAYDGDEGFQCVCPQGQNSPHSCEHRSVIYGTASFVTGAFGLACAAAAVRTLLASPQANAV